MKKGIRMHCLGVRGRSASFSGRRERARVRVRFVCDGACFPKSKKSSSLTAFESECVCGVCGRFDDVVDSRWIAWIGKQRAAQKAAAAAQASTRGSHADCQPRIGRACATFGPPLQHV
jgi:hypothetical protein